MKKTYSLFCLKSNAGASHKDTLLGTFSTETEAKGGMYEHIEFLSSLSGVDSVRVLGASSRRLHVEYELAGLVLDSVLYICENEEMAEFAN